MQARRMDLSRWVPAFLLGAMAIFVTLLAVLPVQGVKNTWTWHPKEAEPARVALPVVGAVPQKLTVDLSCAAVRVLQLARLTAGSDAPVTLFATGSATGAYPIVWRIDPRHTWVELGGRRSRVLDSPDWGTTPDCRAILTYDDATQQVILEPGTGQKLTTSTAEESTRVVAVNPARPTVLSLETDPALFRNITVSVEPSITTVVWPAWRWLLVLGTLGCAFGLLVWLRRVERASPAPEASAEGQKAGSVGKRWTGSDVAVAVSGILAFFLVPPLSDDGWVLATLRSYESLGTFSNFFTARGAAQPQGFWWTWFERFWIGPLGTPIWAMRLHTLAIMVLAWWLLRRYVLDRVVPEHRQRHVHIVSAAVFIVGVLAWTPTLRPEPLIVLLAAVQFALLIPFFGRPRWSLLLAQGLLAAFAVALHQTGWVNAGIAAATLPSVVALVRGAPNPRRELSVLAGVVLTSGFVLAALLFLHSNISLWLASQAAFTSESLHDQMFFEADRIAKLAAGFGVSTMRMLSAGALYASAILFIAAPRRTSPEIATRIGWAGMCGLAGMVLTSSKWPWHFGAEVGVSAVLAGIGAMRLMQPDPAWRRARVAGAAAGVLMLGFFANLKPNSWAAADTRTIDWQGGGLFDLASPMPWVVVGLGIAVVSLAAGAARRDTSAMPWILAVVSVVALTAVSSLGPLALDGLRRPETSWAGQVLRSFTPGTCGLADLEQMRISLGTQPLLQTAPAPQGTPNMNTIATDRMGMAPPVPSAYFGVPFEPATKTYSTPWFGIGDGKDLRTWVHTRTDRDVAYDINWDLGDGKSTRESVRYLPSVEMWSLVPLNPPEGARSVRISWEPDSSVQAALAPVKVVSWTSLREALAGGPVWATAPLYPWMPCLPPTGIPTGTYGKTRYHFGVPQIGPTSGAAANTSVFSEQACLESARTERVCIYRAEAPRPGSLTRASELVNR